MSLKLLWEEYQWAGYRIQAMTFKLLSNLSIPLLIRSYLGSPTVLLAFFFTLTLEL